MADDAPRRTFRLHLSTCVILLFAAGALIGANLYPQRSFPAPNVMRAIVQTNYGWPLVGKIVVSNIYEDIDEWKLDNLVLDIIANAAILYAVAHLCEWRIRRWEKTRAERKE
ncbi:MAG: hypothetical protein KIS92_20335 [Planctomycetota bacterium]|nr:hypothetical protein [Planctomycetota bacterium]